MQTNFQKKLLKHENVGCVAEAGRRAKNDKYAKKCAEVGLLFLPFALDATGGFSDDASKFIRELCSQEALPIHL